MPPTDNPLKRAIPALPRADIGPARLAVCNMESALQFTEALIKAGGHHYFCFCEASLLSSLIRNPELAATLRTSSAIFADGIAPLLIARLCGKPLPERIPGPSFFLSACAYGVERRWRHFFYGAGPGVPETLHARVQQWFPGIMVVGTCSPPFRPLTEAEENETKRMIEAAKPDVLWVGLGSPKQERWCASHLGRINVPLMLPVGAAFDFHSGARPWAPPWVRKMGMEWAFRTITGGKRISARNLRCVSIAAAYIFWTAGRRLFGQVQLEHS